MPTFDLGGRTAVITGATGAIGSAVARTLVESGAKVALIARNRRRLERLCARFPEEAETLVCSADVSSAYDLVEARDKVLEELGAPDLVITAAGVRRAANFDEAIPADWRRMLATNLRGTLQTVQTFSPDVLAAGERGDRADIVMLSSAPARERQHAYSVFSSLGASLGQFSKHLRAEYGLRGVRCITSIPSTRAGVSLRRAIWDPIALRVTITTLFRGLCLSLKALRLTLRTSLRRLVLRRRCLRMSTWPVPRSCHWKETDSRADKV